MPYYVIKVSGPDPERLRYEVEGIIEFVAAGESDVDTYTTGPFEDGPSPASATTSSAEPGKLSNVAASFGLDDHTVQEVIDRA